MLLRFLRCLFWGAFIYAIAAAIVYLSLPGDFEHAVALVSVTSWVSLKQGLPLFHPADASSIYDLMYGPLLFLSHWPAFALFKGSFFASKITGVIVFFISLVLFLKLLKKIKFIEVQLFLGFFFLYWILGCDNFFYNNRADAFLFFWTLIAAFVFWSKEIRPDWQLVLTAIIAALCFNYKIHAVIYVAPFLGVLAIKNIKNFIIAAVVFVAVAVLPWLFLPGQFEIYFGILKNLSRTLGHTEIRQVLVMNASVAITYFALCRPQIRKEYRWLYLFSFVAIVLGTLFAMREGSGKNQIVPIIPCYLTFFITSEAREFQKKYQALVMLVGIYLAICMIKDQKDLFGYFAQASSLIEKNQEIESLVKDLPDHSILWIYSEKSYIDSYLRPQIYFMNKGSDFIADAVTLMENVHGGIPFPTAALERLKSCTAPYAMSVTGGGIGISHSFYDSSNVFPDQWAKDFVDHYDRITVLEHYTLWKCHSP